MSLCFPSDVSDCVPPRQCFENIAFAGKEILTSQKSSRRPWRPQRRKSRSVPEGRADFPAAIFLAGKCTNLGRASAFRTAGELVKNFPAASLNLPGKEFWTATAFSSVLN